jgi:lipopolysaccharide transport system permease protein
MTQPAPSLEMQPPVSASNVHTIIRPRSGWPSIDLAELVRFRELLLILTMRNIRVRYKQTLLGALWAVLQPAAQMVVFTAFFAARGFSTEGMPAPLFYLAALVPWQFFATSLASSTNSIVDNQNLITKIYFPRLLIPLAAIASSLLDLLVSFAFLLIMMLWYHVAPGPQILLIPVFVVLAGAAALAIGLWLSALNVQFRDVRYVVPFAIQLWLFLTPIIYPSSSVTGLKRTLISLNPMSGVVEGFRYCLFGQPRPDLSLAVSAVSIGVFLVGGLLYFSRMETTFADRL